MTGLGKGSRKGLTEGLREFIKIDGERALEVGFLNRGMGKLKKYESRRFLKDAQR